MSFEAAMPWAVDSLRYRLDVFIMDIFCYPWRVNCCKVSPYAKKDLFKGIPTFGLEALYHFAQSNLTSAPSCDTCILLAFGAQYDRCLVHQILP